MTKKEEERVFDFGEKKIEKVKNKQTNQWENMEVWQTPKYLTSKEKAIELIEKGDYGLSEGDFWILMNRGGSKMCYTGLIISHNGCLKINDKLEDNLKFKPESVSFLVDEGGNKVMQYINNEQGVYEFGEISPKNCSNDYPYAMVLKRLMDRVILKNSKVGFFGIYSDSESEEFKEKPEEKPEAKTDKQKLANISDNDMKETLLEENKNLAERLVAKIKSFGSVSELEGWLEDKAVKSAYNKLAKYYIDGMAEVTKAESDFRNEYSE